MISRRRSLSRCSITCTWRVDPAGVAEYIGAEVSVPGQQIYVSKQANDFYPASVSPLNAKMPRFVPGDANNQPRAATTAIAALRDADE